MALATPFYNVYWHNAGALIICWCTAIGLEVDFVVYAADAFAAKADFSQSDFVCEKSGLIAWPVLEVVIGCPPYRL